MVRARLACIAVVATSGAACQSPQPGPAGAASPPAAAAPAPPEASGYPPSAPLVTKADPRTGIDHVVLQGVTLRAGPRQASVDMMVSNIIEHSIIPASIAAELGVAPSGEVELPADDGSGIDAAEHLRVVYGMNRTGQRRFRVVRLDEASLGVGPPLAPVAVLVSDDANSAIGLVGRDWLRRRSGEAGFIITAGGLPLWGPPGPAPRAAERAATRRSGCCGFGRRVRRRPALGWQRRCP